MRRVLLSLALLVPISAEAANNTVLLTPCSSGCVTMRSQDVGAGVESAVNILGDTSGNAIYGTAGTANANVLTVQGIASMTPILANPGTAANWGLGATGAAVPANAIYLGATVGGNLTGLVATSNGLKVDGSAVTQPTSAASGQFVDGAIVTIGAEADAAAGSDTATATLIALLKRNNQNLTTLNTTAGAAATLAAASTGGCTGATLLTAASNNATVIGSAAAHTLCYLRWENTTTSLVDIRLYDTATAPSGGAPCNSATNVVSNDVVQSNAVSPGGVANFGPFGQAFASGIVICVTGANANNDNTNAVTGVNISYGYK